MRKLYTALILSSLAASTSVIAGNHNVSIVGTVPTFVPDSQTNVQPLAGNVRRGHYVMLEKIQLSERAQTYLADTIDIPDRPLLNAGLNIAVNKNIGMNNVPVLDQGRHGTCATFAVTGALDAALGKPAGELGYISQLCNLDLGNYLEKQDKQYPSGWDGSLGYIVLDQIKSYGILNTEYQLNKGCGDPEKLSKAYPLNDGKDKGSVMSVDTFTRNSEKIMDSISYTKHLDIEDALSNSANMSQVLTKVKNAISNNHRVVIGLLIDDNGPLENINGAQGSYKIKNDSWVLSKTIKQDAQIKNKIRSGHAVIVVGYDDNAVVKAPDGNHKGVLTLRNSWGKKAGNAGEYYMTYDYFTKMLLEVEEIVPKA